MIFLDQSWQDFDNRADMLFAELFPTVIDDPNYMMNVSKFKKQRSL